MHHKHRYRRRRRRHPVVRHVPALVRARARPHRGPPLALGSSSVCQTSTTHGLPLPKMTLSQIANSIDICRRHPNVLMKISSATVSDPVVPFTSRK